ncbi:P-loop ATPase, Sll1717 family [Paraburkholderia sediminicola]|uniref:P-loop ATPase, Sll1717 family n=1 Tax=Paraburkholderia sediminicola TaxID=458836 RepID=UPI0038B7D49C
MSIIKDLNLNDNPFEHYTAETEPNIADYAIRPPYLQAISDRANKLSSFILFGDRGAGKSATRVTVYKEIWESLSRSESPNKKPFIVNLTDFSDILVAFKREKLTERDIVWIAAFAIIEQMFVWLSSLEEDDRHGFTESLGETERNLVMALLKGFYLSKPELDREHSTSEALKLLNSAWTTKSVVWTSQRWDSLSKIVASAVNIFAKKTVDDSVDISGAAESILKSLVGESPSAPRAILNKLVEFSRSFGFSGVCVLVDKLDETSATSNSAESTAKLIHPLLTHIQLLEVTGFSWIFFLWSNVKVHFDNKHPVRLDKIAHANITWDHGSLQKMVDERIKFFSSNTLLFKDLFSKELGTSETFKELIEISVSSPRELIKLMDIMFREHDARGAIGPLDRATLEIGQNKYCTETIGSWYAKSPLQQVFRVGKVEFVNKDVQSVFKISDQGARVKIRSWEDAGLVKQDGTVPSDSGGKPVYRYVVADSRVRRIIKNKLDAVVGAEIEEPEIDDENLGD